MHGIVFNRLLCTLKGMQCALNRKQHVELRGNSDLYKLFMLDNSLFTYLEN